MARVKKCRVLPSGANSVRNSGGVTAKLESMGKSIAASASSKTPVAPGMKNDNYYVHTHHGRQRVFVNVVVGNTVSRRDNAKNNTLVKSLDAGRK